jgi:hypothetical protein
MRVHEIKKLLYRKEMITGLKRQPTEWEKIFVSCTSDKGLIIRICREIKNKLSTKSMTQ